MRKSLLTTIFIIAAVLTFSGLAIGWMRPSAGGAAGRSGSTADASGGAADPAAIRHSVSKSLTILQKSGYLFTERARLHCASCHHSTMTSMVEEKSKQKGLTFIDTFKNQRIMAMLGTIRFACNVNTPDMLIPAKFIAPYVLLGLAAEKYPGNAYVDIAVDYIINQQKPDGTFGAEFGRTPLEGGEMHLAALCIRAMQLYVAPGQKEKADQVTRRTRSWLENASPDVQQELAFQLLGLQWCGSTAPQKEKVAIRLRSAQHPDGGWSQLPTMTSDAYATGQALYALAESGLVSPGDEVYQKGINWLLQTQDASGAWIVATRAFAIQPFFNSGFPPYDENQYISAAATNWAALALLDALPDVASTALNR
jgi:hypothetical protein